MPEASVQIIGRMAQLLEAVASAGSAGLRLTDAVAATGLGKTTAHRLFTALAEIGYVVHDAGTRAYRIGPAIGRLAAMGDARDLASVAAPVLRDLARETQDTVFLSVRDGSEAICIAREVGRFPIRTLTLDPGDRRPLGVGAGSAALLAGLEEAELPAVLDDIGDRLDAFARFDRARLVEDRARTRAQGYALNKDGVVEGMSAIGMELRDARGALAGAISVAAISARMKPDRRRTIVAALRAARREIERGLGRADASERAA